MFRISPILSFSINLNKGYTKTREDNDKFIILPFSFTEQTFDKFEEFWLDRVDLVGPGVFVSRFM